ncbi:O-acetylserine/cysteine efflux transporter [Luteibacter sp. Sphag1AF]|uniref:EamA family transporter n=1 Tax=Luteibacter sp. Sphag1AF TaxID=2587031 RepID=UPI001610C339|nr:EamA family transporter [Luteibacter sp. Sphag1AF]MBB3226045.1 O-acetylserine/cysteine efflux transporter [Luteibacter sp. Sphag1AF]
MKPLDLALGVLVALIWGCNFSVIEVGLHDLSPFLLTALRFAFSAVPLIFFVRRPRGRQMLATAAYGVLFGVGLWWVVNLAMTKGMSPGLSSLVLQFSAFFTIVLSWLFLHEPIRRPQMAGMIISLVGLIGVIAFADAVTTVTGSVLVLIAALSWSICNIIVKKSRPEDMIAFIAWSSAVAAPVLFALAWLDAGSAAFVGLADHLTAGAVFSVLFQAYVTTVFGYMVWNRLMKKYPAASVAPLSLLVPISGLVTSAIWFGEVLSTRSWMAIAVVLAGIAVFVVSGAVALRRAPVAGAAG